MKVTLQEAQIYSRMGFNQYKLKGYSIVWHNWPHTLGEAWPIIKQIHLSHDCLKSSSLFREVFDHELSHCLDWIERGGTFERNGRNDYHGKNWKKWCKIVGVRARRFIPVSR